MNGIEPDRDYGDESEATPVSTGLCSRCRETEALPNEEWCAECVLEVELLLAEAEDAA